MDWNQIVLGALVIIGGAGVSASIGAWASRRFGLQGIARDVDAGQTKLISTLRERLELAEEDAADAKAQAAQTERKRRDCEIEVGRMRTLWRATERDLLLAEIELKDLYEKLGQVPPKRLEDHIEDMAKRQGEPFGN
jgi:hypothetical protein